MSTFRFSERDNPDFQRKQIQNLWWSSLLALNSKENIYYIVTAETNIYKNVPENKFKFLKNCTKGKQIYLSELF